MLADAFNAVLRLGLRLIYPIVCTAERVVGIETEVATVAVWHQGRLLVVKHSYWPESGLPGGAIKSGEAPAHAAARELREEVGISADPDDLAFSHVHPRKEGPMWVYEYRPARAPRIVPDRREIITARFMDAERLPASLTRILTVRSGV